MHFTFFSLVHFTLYLRPLALCCWYCYFVMTFYNFQWRKKEERKWTNIRLPGLCNGSRYTNFREATQYFYRLTLESLISVTLVIRVPQSNRGVKIVLYGFLNEIKLFRMVSLLCSSIWVCYSTFNFWIIANSTAKKLRTVWNFG